MSDRNLRRFGRIAIDLILVAVSAPVALLVRENFVFAPHRLEAVIPYAVLCVLSAVIVFSAFRLQRSLWRYVSLTDVVRLGAAVAVALLLALLGDFVLRRLEGVARSLPVIQWFVLVGAMAASRIAVRLWGERRSRGRRQFLAPPKPTEHVLVVGFGELTELYLRALTEVAPSHLIIEGLVCSGPHLRGGMMRSHKILGKPEDLSRILNTLDVHGVTIDRIVVTEPFEHFPRSAQDALIELERSLVVKVMWLVEVLGLHERAETPASVGQQGVEPNEVVAPSPSQIDLPQYHRLKRAVDCMAASVMVVLLSPLLVLVAVLVVIDVGTPLVFWQKRPGRYGRSIKLFKFRTMGAAHDEHGNRIPDDLRSSTTGRFLRRRWLDELPQLYNILVGEMSFVGPRPLLPSDQPDNKEARQLVRPGLTGWAQINGGRDILPEEKAALDLWYVTNASLWVDIKILLATLRAMMFGSPSDWGEPKPI